jgi:hypothetical protein
MPNVEMQGVVVAQDLNDPLPSDLSPHAGLYLQTDDGLLIELVGGSMVEQRSVESMWQESRRDFEAYLGQRVTVQGYLSRRTLYGAHVTEPLPD